MPLPLFSYAPISIANKNPVYVNLFEPKLYNETIEADLEVSEDIFDITFDTDTISDTITFLVYNNEETLLSIDRIKNYKYASISVFSKTGSIIEIYFLKLDFKSVQTNYSFDLNQTNRGVNIWKTTYDILDRRSPEINLDDFIKSYKREVNISKLED